MGLALVGYGYWGQKLARCFHALGVLEMICDNDESSLQEAKNKYPGIAFERSCEQAFNSSSVTALAIASPAQFHYTMAKKALNCGLHVFVEKPLALSLPETLDLASYKDSKLLVGHIFRYHPCFKKMLELVHSGFLGRLKHIEAHRLNDGIIRQHESALWSLAPHDLSMILALLQNEPEEVSITKEFDFGHIHLNFPDAISAHVYVNWLSPYKERRLTVTGEEGVLDFDDTAVWEKKLCFYPRSKQMQVYEEPRWIQVDISEPMMNECQHFIDLCLHGGEALTGVQEGLSIARILSRLNQ